MHINKWTLGITSGFISGTLLALSISNAHAQELNAKLLNLSSGELALIMEHEHWVLTGHATPSNDYVRLDLESREASSGETREGSAGTGQASNNNYWGYAEILLSCDDHQLVLYQSIEGSSQEILIGTIPNVTNACQ